MLSSSRMIIALSFLSMVVGLAQGFIAGYNISPLKIASFNVRHFGKGYIEDETTHSYLVKIMARYDIVLVQETRDNTGEAIEHLRKNLDEATGEFWKVIESKKLGTNSRYLEQYVYFYRDKSATFVSSYQVNDSKHDIYAREPFCVEFAYTSSSKRHRNSKVPIHRENVVFLAIHTRPKDTRKELEELPHTIELLTDVYPHASGIIAMGDMNADCDFLAGKWRKSLTIFNNKKYNSLISDTADTVVKESSDCAYDRVITYGRHLNIKNAKVFNYQSWLHLDEEEALKISDHFPVEFDLY